MLRHESGSEAGNCGFRCSFSAAVVSKPGFGALDPVPTGSETLMGCRAGTDRPLPFNTVPSLNSNFQPADKHRHEKAGGTQNDKLDSSSASAGCDVQRESSSWILKPRRVHFLRGRGRSILLCNYLKKSPCFSFHNHHHQRPNSGYLNSTINYRDRCLADNVALSRLT